MINEEKRENKSSQRMLWLALVVGVLVVFGGLITMTRKRPEKKIPEEELSGELNFGALNDIDLVEPEDWFVAHSGEVSARGLDILKVLSKDELTLDEVLPVVRNSRQAQLVLAMAQAGAWPGFDTRKPALIKAECGSSAGVGFLAMAGIKKDFRDFRAYFVRDGEDIYLDVEASEGLSDIPVGELVGKSLTKSALVRCWIAKEPHFDGRSDEKIFSWYQVSGPDKIDIVWAYCKRGDPLDELLRQKLNYGYLIGKRKSSIRATITLGSMRDYGDDEFLLEDFLASEWVLPSGR